MIALTLAAVETGSLFVAVCAVTLLGAQPALLDGLMAAMGPALAVSICCLVCFYCNDLYDLRTVRGLRESAPRVLQSLCAAFVLFGACYALLPMRVEAPRLAAIVLLAGGLVLPVRALCYEIIAKRAPARRVLVLGTGSLARKITDEIETSPHLRYAVAGFVSEGAPAEGLRPGYAVWPLARVCEALEELHPDRVVVAFTERRGRLPVWSLLASCANGVRVEDGVAFYEQLTEKLAIESLSPSAFIFSGSFRRPRFHRTLRRAVDLAILLAGLPLSGPLMALIAILVKLDSRGPVFFVQERTGLGGRTFRLIKFRTMHEAPAGVGEPVWHRENGSRVTRVGRWLRRFHIDELPQFFNILKGDMALIGPRPEIASNVKTMAERIPYYPLRHTVRPGVTGWAQVRQGYSMSQAEVTEKIRYDLYYVRHMSLWLDLRILADTAKIVVLGRKAS